MFAMKIQPIDAIRADQAKPVVVKSRLKRLFERQLLRISSSEKLAGGGGGAGELEPSSVVLDKMVRNFMEDNNEKASSKCCNCFQGNCDDSSDDDLDFGSDAPIASSSTDASDVIKGLIVCASVAERNLAADASSIMDNSKNSRTKEELRNVLTDGLRSLGYDAAICKSRWDKSPSYPAGEHEYIDVIVDGGYRILIEIDFRSEFEIARSTKSYRALLQSLPTIFVGTSDRLAQIVSVVSEAAKQSLKKKGLHVPPWRKHEYVRAKWLAPSERATRVQVPSVDVAREVDDGVTWQLPTAKPKADQSGSVIVTGLASVLRENA